MGQLDHYINIWHWKADWQSDIDRRAAKASEKARDGVRTFEVIPRRVSSVEDLIGGGFSTLTTKEKQGRVQGKAVWKDGVWHVVMRRPLVSEEQENEAKLIPGRVQTVSFAVWNGENKERNGQKSSRPRFSLSSTQSQNSSKMLKMAASFVLSRGDLRCDVPRGYASLSSLPAASLDDHFDVSCEIALLTDERRERWRRISNQVNQCSHKGPSEWKGLCLVCVLSAWEFCVVLRRRR